MEELLKQLLEGQQQLFDGQQQLSSEIKGIHAKLDSEVKGIHTKLGSEVQGLHAKLDTEVQGIHDKLDSEIKGIHTKLDTEVQGIHAKLDTLEGQQCENTAIIKALLHNQEIANANVESLKLTTPTIKAMNEGFNNIDNKVDTLNQRLFYQEAEMNKLRIVK